VTGQKYIKLKKDKLAAIRKKLARRKSKPGLPTYKNAPAPPPIKWVQPDPHYKVDIDKLLRNVKQKNIYDELLDLIKRLSDQNMVDAMKNLPLP